MNFFDTLSDNDQQVLINAISQIALLIAGADGEVDEKETHWAEKITKIRSYAGPEELLNFYSVVGQDFNERFMSLLEEMPEETNLRTEALSSRLEKVNAVLQKLEPEVAYHLYSGFLRFAKHVAKASGGFLRIMSISRAEAKLIELDMINPVEKPPMTEEEE